MAQNVLPPLLSDTPPPAPLDSDDDDEFGDFEGPNCYGDDDFSPPGTPPELPKEENPKDFYDRRKSEEIASEVKFTDFSASDTSAAPSDTSTATSDTSTATNNVTSDSTNCDTKQEKEEFEAEFGDFATSSDTTKKEEFAAEFGDFATSSNTIKKEEFGEFATSSDTTTKKEEFGDFATSSDTKQEKEEFEAEFGDFATSSNTFGEFATSSDTMFDNVATFTEFPLGKASDIIEVMFPPTETLTSDFQGQDLVATDKIFHQIKNITDTHALNFHWPKSHSQNLLLKSLNIDSRNIFHCGPNWPKFASNLSLVPLEPVKSLTLTADSEPVNKSLTSDSSSEALPCKDRPDPPDTKKNVPVVQKPPKSPDIRKPIAPKTIVLRETHISGVTSDIVSDVVKTSDISKTSDIVNVSFLEPTIVTPELVRKERPAYVEEDFEDFHPQTEETDDFGEFASSLPQKLLEPLKPLTVEAISSSSITWPDPGITDEEIGRFEALGIFRNNRNKPVIEDEEWTDFVSKSPMHRCATPDLPLSVLNLPIPTVKPTTVPTVKQSSIPTATTVKQQSILNLISDQYANCSKSEDDEWSDFVSHEVAMPDLSFFGARK